MRFTVCQMKSEQGTYAVIFQCRRRVEQRVGRWGTISLREGYYVYVGSAFGPGGVSARVLHHYRKTARPHWHIDYLSEFMSPIIVWYTHHHGRLEHQWAKALSRLNGLCPIKGFGCSDCKCYSHLFFTHVRPEPARFFKALGGGIEIRSFKLQ
jgi:Uri superfamily endonuclease